MAPTGIQNNLYFLPRNPRRKPAHESVSLRRGPTVANSAVKREAGTVESQTTSENSSMLRTKISSGETSNAEHWFENRNENVNKPSTPYPDNDPPFYHDQSPPVSNPIPAMSLPLRPGLAPVTTTGSGSEEYRSVIDDLTIENKKLKRKLKHFQLHRSQLDSEKLFEVRMHGLPLTKKQELKELLSKFAQGLDQSPVSAPKATSSDHSTSRIGVALKPTSTVDSIRVADSGYGSMTNSGHASTAHSGITKGPKERLEASEQRNMSIQSYLSDIPLGLMPRPRTAMTEKTKKKLVVRRLESIFGGRGAAPGVHQQPLQQQEVSHSAARADQTALEARGQELAREGVREAQIMADETEDPMDYIQGKVPNVLMEGQQASDRTNKVQQHDFAISEVSCLEQRPTRPLDLDPNRAQVPTENIEYMRHLGFSVPDADTKKVDKDAADGWVYLNLLIGLAQLHTFNVTPEFVQKAVLEHSSKLELSKDARKVRWKGLGSPVPSSLLNENSPDHSPYSHQPNESRKRPRAVPAGGNDIVGESSKRPAVLEQMNKLAYTPLFPPKEDSDSDSDMSMASSDSESSPEQTGESSGLTSTVKLMRKCSMNKSRDDGPIIFYNQATFCTDLSGDTSKNQRPLKISNYQAITSCPIGASPWPSAVVFGTDRASRRPLLAAATSASDSGTTSYADLPDTSTDADLEFPRASPKHVTFAEPEEPFEFKVSGIGGVYPRDNLAINVVRQHFIDPNAPAPRPISSSKLAKILSHRSVSSKPGAAHRRPREAILSTRHIRYKPSPLPPPSYAFVDDGSVSGSDDDSDMSLDDGEDLTSSSTANQLTLRGPGPRTSFPTSDPVLSNSPSVSGTESDDGSNSPSGLESGNQTEDSRVDFLAAARAIDPETIRVKEREYDAYVADRLAEEIPAGSSAATAGGGSGYNSPAGPDDRQDAYMGMNMGGDDNEEDQSVSAKSIAS